MMDSLVIAGSSVVGEDIDRISLPVEEPTVISTESQQVLEEMEVAVANTSSDNHTVASAGDANEKFSTFCEASTIRMEKLNAIRRSQDRRFILNNGGLKFETCADTMVSDPNSLPLDLIQKVSPVKPYKVEGRS